MIKRFSPLQASILATGRVSISPCASRGQVLPESDAERRCDTMRGVQRGRSRQKKSYAR